MAMNRNDDEEIKKRMRKAIDHASTLSQDQESEIREVKELAYGSMTIRDQAEAAGLLIRR